MPDVSTSPAGAVLERLALLALVLMAPLGALALFQGWPGTPLASDHVLPALSAVIQRDGIMAHAGSLSVPFLVKNTGDGDLEEVQVLVSGDPDPGEPAILQVIRHLPVGETRQGTAILPGTSTRPTIRIRGYQKP